MSAKAQGSKLSFPKGFLWGSATAAYQVEGAPQVDGKGPSIWDTFTHQAGTIERGENADQACLHFKHWKEDVALMKSLGMNAYRFSIAWTRLLPHGRGHANEKGVGFYNGLIDELLRQGIKPLVTLYHWDLPQALEDQGGWTSRDTAHSFADYATLCARRFGDRVDFWATHNEPWCAAHLGYETGIHAPGRLEAPKVVNQVIHHLLLSHGLGYDALKAASPKKCDVGIVLNPEAVWPASASVEDREAASKRWRLVNDWWLEPLFAGRYPSDAWEWKGQDVPELKKGDLDAIKGRLDFLGINFYTPLFMKQASSPEKSDASGGEIVPKSPRAEGSSMPGWEVKPAIAEFLPLEVTRRWGPLPLYVTENGYSDEKDAPDASGKISDPKRISYLKRHLAHMHRAIKQGVDLRGYVCWSMMDNFEWSFGFRQRFGLAHVDFATQQRRLKESGHWFSRTAAQNGFDMDEALSDEALPVLNLPLVKKA